MVIDTELEKSAFRKAIFTMKENMAQAGVSVSVGISWRGSRCSKKEQFDEADRQMYQTKAIFYSSHNNDRRQEH